MSREILQIPVDTTAHPETEQRWHELREAVASELGVQAGKLSKWEILREASEAYCGGDSLGAWRDDENE